MSLFNMFKKEKPEKKVETKESKGGDVMPEDIQKVDIDKEYPYVVKLYDIEDKTVVGKKPFGAKRYIDGANVWLVNEKVGFKEPFPKNTTEFRNYTLTEIEKNLNRLKNKLEKVRNDKKTKGRVTSDEKDILQEIRKFRAYQRSHIVEGNGSYMIISQEHGGRPLYSFDRIGSFKMPVYKNVDNHLLYIPTEADIATAGELLKLNEDENGIKDNTFKLITIGMVIILALAVCGVSWIGYKSSQTPTEITESLKELADSNKVLTGEIVDGLQEINNVTSKIEIKDVDSKVIPKTVEVDN